MEKYSVIKFAQATNESEANIRTFRSQSRKFNYLVDRQPLTGDHIPVFLEIQKLQNSGSYTWESACAKVLPMHVQPSLTTILQQILKSQTEILNLLNRLLPSHT